MGAGGGVKKFLSFLKVSNVTLNLISSKLTCRNCGREGGRKGCSDMKDHGTITVHMMDFCSPGLHMFGSFEELYCEGALASSLTYVILMITLHDRNGCQSMFPLINNI